MPSTKDLTVGQPSRVLLRFTLPLFLSVFFQQLYNMADSAIAGRCINEDALAAIGASYPITMLFMSVAMGSQIGCSVVIGRLYGSKSFDRVRSCVSTALVSGVIISLILSIFGVMLSKSLLIFLHTPDNIFTDSLRYLQIYTMGYVFVHLYNVVTGLFSSMGDSKTPLYLLIFSSLGNIALDMLFVLKFKQGVAGLARATVLAQGLACVLSLVVIARRMRTVPKNHETAWFTWRDFTDIVTIAIPSTLQQSFISIGNLLIQNLVNPYGSSVIAGFSAAIKLNTFALTCFTNMGTGLSSFTAQNLGAAKPERVRKGFRAGVICACVTAFVFSACYYYFDSSLLQLFMEAESSETAMETGRTFLKITSPLYSIICIKIMADGVLRGSGSMGYFMAATLIDLTLRVILAHLLDPIYGATGIWKAWPASWLIATALSYCFYRKNVWSSHIAKVSSE